VVDLTCPKVTNQHNNMATKLSVSKNVFLKRERFLVHDLPLLQRYMYFLSPKLAFTMGLLQHVGILTIWHRSNQSMQLSSLVIAS
jgi:hypothetical protein